MSDKKLARYVITEQELILLEEIVDGGACCKEHWQALAELVKTIRGNRRKQG